MFIKITYSLFNYYKAKRKKPYISYNKKELQVKKTFHFAPLFSLDLSQCRVTADLPQIQITLGLLLSPCCPSKTLSLNLMFFGVLTASSCTCHAAALLQKRSTRARILSQIQFPGGGSRSHAGCCSRLFVSGIEDGYFRVTVHQVSSPFLFPEQGSA